MYLTARSHEELSATCDELRSFTSEIEFAALDLTEPDAATKLATYVEQLWGGLDILVTNAGAAPQGGFLELKDEDWATGFGLKLFANLRVIKTIWPMLMAAKGHLIMIGGGTARMPERHLSLVSAVNGGYRGPVASRLPSKGFRTAFMSTWSSRARSRLHAARN